jgi:organic radical activating enzyme
MDKIYLAEEPHFVIQGEGNLIGKKMLLFRVAGCNIKCKDCDSKHTWYSMNNLNYSIKELEQIIKDKYNEKEFEYIMITGGAPSLYIEFIYNIIKRNKKWKFQIEDAGDKDWSKFKKFKNVWFSFSPKIGALKGATNIKEWEAFQKTPKNFICKIVVDKNDWVSNSVDILEFQYKYKIPSDKIYLMPIGTHVNEIQEQCQFLIDKCFEYKFNFSPRLHILMFDDKRMV